MAQFLQMRDVSLVPQGCSTSWMYLGLSVQMAHSVCDRNYSHSGMSRSDVFACRSAFVSRLNTSRLVVKLIRRIDVNASRFRLDEKESEYRSRVFWHLFSVDTWTARARG